MKKHVLFFLAFLCTLAIACKKESTQAEPIEFIKPTSVNITASAGSKIDLQAKLTVNDKIDKLEVFQKIGAGTQTLITNKGFSNSTNTDVYTDTYTVPAGTPAGSVIILTFVLHQKNTTGPFATKILTITVN
jgi:hypothetical protein